MENKNETRFGSDYPYVVVRVMSGVYQKTKIPRAALLLDGTRKWAKEYAARIKRRVCLVLSASEAEYYSPTGELECVTSPPSGGMWLGGIATPKPGDIIYIDSALYLTHGEDDMVGGKARVLTVGEKFGPRMITVEGWPDDYRNWDGLAAEQESLKAKFGDSWAFKWPDSRPEFNESGVSSADLSAGAVMYTKKIQDAITLAIETHEVHQKQKRKGKDMPYITHPLSVGLILARAGASEDVVAAGILHDTIEDSILTQKVSFEMLAKRFGDNVANLVLSVTEIYKALSWDDRKTAALHKIAAYSRDSLLVKAADTLSNVAELIADYERDGESVFDRFGAPKETLLRNHLLVIRAIIGRWPENPLAEDLRCVADKLRRIA